jgi:predicted Rossmann fold flavoprotein
MECKRLGVSFLYGEKVIRVERPNFTVVTKVQENRIIKDEKSSASSDKIKNNDLRQKPDSSEVNLHKYFSALLILAAGGCAAPKLGSDGSGYALAKAFGHTLIKPLPALVQLKSSDKFCKTLSGVRTIAKVAAYGQDNLLDEEEGEIIFTDYGISGIPIMQLSRFAAKALDQKKKVHLLIDYLPGICFEDINSILKQRIKRFPSKTVEEMMVGLFNHKLSYILIKEAKLDPVSLAKAITPQQLLNLSKQIKEFRMMITDTNSFENAQVCAGGIATREVDETTMESKLVRNLYLAGELLDVDGTCGGYNLQWAWSSGYLAGASAGIMKADKIRTGVK